MEKHDLNHLESKLRELAEACKSVGDTADLNELLNLIRRPGWTSIAEGKFAVSIVDSLLTQTRNVTELRRNLLAGSKDVELGRGATA